MDLDHYNVVWDSPSKNSYGSMPIGNGDIGLNVWVEPDRGLLFYIGKTDAWSENGRLLKLGRVRVGISPTPFGKGQPFKQTLDLAGTDVIVCGHSHVPMVTPFEDKTVINAGALGMPEDGDNRAQCFIIEDGMVHFDRVAYDLEAHANDYAKSHMPEEHADYYLRANRQGFVDSRGPRPGPLAEPRRNILAVNRCSLEEEQR